MPNSKIVAHCDNNSPTVTACLGYSSDVYINQSDCISGNYCVVSQQSALTACDQYYDPSTGHYVQSCPNGDSDGDRVCDAPPSDQPPSQPSPDCSNTKPIDIGCDLGCIAPFPPSGSLYCYNGCTYEIGGVCVELPNGSWVCGATPTGSSCDPDLPSDPTQPVDPTDPTKPQPVSPTPDPLPPGSPGVPGPGDPGNPPSDPTNPPTSPIAPTDPSPTPNPEPMPDPTQPPATPEPPPPELPQPPTTPITPPSPVAPPSPGPDPTPIQPPVPPGPNDGDGMCQTPPCPVTDEQTHDLLYELLDRIGDHSFDAADLDPSFQAALGNFDSVQEYFNQYSDAYFSPVGNGPPFITDYLPKMFNVVGGECPNVLYERSGIQYNLFSQFCDKWDVYGRPYIGWFFYVVTLIYISRIFFESSNHK